MLVRWVKISCWGWENAWGSQHCWRWRQRWELAGCQPSFRLGEGPWLTGVRCGLIKQSTGHPLLVSMCTCICARSPQLHIHPAQHTRDWAVTGISLEAVIYSWRHQSAAALGYFRSAQQADRWAHRVGSQWWRRITDLHYALFLLPIVPQRKWKAVKIIISFFFFFNLPNGRTTFLP